jgi:hypothetical protein
VDGGSGLILPSPELARHYNRKMRRAMRQMAEALGIDHEDPRYAEVDALWDEIRLRVAGGKMTSPASEAPPVGDPFAIFVRAVCNNHREPYEMTLVHKCRGDGHAYDEFEAREVVEYLKAEMAVCELCSEPITTWSAEQNRISIYAAKDKVRIGDDAR